MLINTEKSPYAKVYPLPQDNIKWKNGFWKDRFDQCAKVTIPHIIGLFEDKDIFHAIENFRISAGDTQGDFAGTPYGDGDFYKLLEGAMYIIAKFKDKSTEEMIDGYIELIGRAQQKDGYISTKQIIGEMQNNGVKRLGDIDDFEVYNFGHLFTAACQYLRITGKDSFLKIAIKAAGYLEELYKEAANTGEVQTAVCPSHYMGLIELYRTTGEHRYLNLAELAISLRDLVKSGTDDNQDRLPLREHTKIVGHAVRSTYLYAGVADLYLETGDESLKKVLGQVWDNLVNKKLYITGGCGALYNGVSPYGDFMQDQMIHQAFGYEYQLPNVTAYNETCSALGNIFWNYRMFAIEPEAKYFDLIERTMYNLALAAVSLDGDKYFYENMLRRTKKLDYELIWPLTRTHIISCFCCPTNLSRCIMEVLEYTYMVNDSEVYLGMYGANEVKLELKNGASCTMIQDTVYPWDGVIRFSFKEVKSEQGFTLKVRIPSWVEKGTINYDGITYNIRKEDGNSYYSIEIKNPKDCIIDIDFAMEVRYTVSHPLVEENNNQVAVERGPLVYCMETPDVKVDSLDDIHLISNADYHSVEYDMNGTKLIALEGEAAVLNWDKNRNALYQPLKVEGITNTPIRMIPYFAWDNRGYGEMRIWMPFIYRY